MLIVPNVGAEQALADTSRLEALRPFVQSSMASLFPSMTHELQNGARLPKLEVKRQYLPTSLVDEIAPESLLAFMNTPDVVEYAATRNIPLVGSTQAMRFHSRDWLFRLQVAEETPWVTTAACFDFAQHTRTEVIALAQEKIHRTPALQRNRTWKPFLSANSSGRCAAIGTELGPDEKQFIINAEHTGLLLEPWATRTRDMSSQYWLSDRSVHWLSSTLQDVSPAGRYKGLTTTWTPASHPVVHIADDFEEAHHALARKVWDAGYRGPLGIDGFDYRDSDHAQIHRICEINARLTMGHLLIGLACSQGDELETSESQLKLQLQI